MLKLQNGCPHKEDCLLSQACLYQPSLSTFSVRDCIKHPELSMYILYYSTGFCSCLLPELETSLLIFVQFCEHGYLHFACFEANQNNKKSFLFLIFVLQYENKVYFVVASGDTRKETMLEQIKADASLAMTQLLAVAKLEPGDLIVIGCSSSEILQETIGTHSSAEVGKAVFEALYEVASSQGIYIAAQCCEHLNRALILEKEAAKKSGYPIVNVYPQPKAGGSFATAAYATLNQPVAVEHIQAQAGMDIGDTLIGMHLQDVAVPVRIAQKTIGAAHVVCARTRPKFIGGERAHYVTEWM